MIKANELRIGNLFKEYDSRGIPLETGWFSKNGVSWVSTINHHGVNETSDMGSSNVTQFKDMDPIDLTEEWLLKLGFTTDPKHHVLCYDLGLLSIELPNKFYSSGRAYFNSWAILNEMPKHVHQLQNLYFALTGEELSL